VQRCRSCRWIYSEEESNNCSHRYRDQRNVTADRGLKCLTAETPAIEGYCHSHSENGTHDASTYAQQ
ncbi:uncharacterized protein METZ01_LOCUS390848, partial [marine metagenome]